MQLVVHEAAVQITWSLVNLSSLTPTTTLRTLGSLTGADTTTRFTPHLSRYGLSTSVESHLPVQSITSSTPIPFQSTPVRSSDSEKAMFFPSTCTQLLLVASTVWPRQVPCTLSYMAR